MKKIVTKFGGSSLADAGQFQKVKAILQLDPRRQYVVPSAPGRRFKEDDKVTDVLAGKLLFRDYAQLIMTEGPNPKCAQLDTLLYARYEEAEAKFPDMMRQLLEHVYEKGHRRIAYIHGADSAVTRERLSSFYRNAE